MKSIFNDYNITFFNQIASPAVIGHMLNTSPPDNNIGTFYSGASGLALPVRNKQMYPPEFQEKSRLCYYGSLFNSIEINSSFYRMPIAKTVAKWADEVPDGFRFTYKLLKDITHNKELLFNPDDVHRFLEVIDAAGEKKGSLLVQLPPSTSVASRGQLQKLLATIQQADTAGAWQVVVEFRNSTWYEDDIYRMLDDHETGMVVHDLPASLAPMMDTEVPYMYLRFHGPNGGYRGSYTDDFLYEYARYVNDWRHDGKTVYAYFNNTMGDAVNNLITLNRFVAELG